MLEALAAITSTVAQQWFALTLVVVFGRVAYLFRKYNFRISMIWFVKLITDPFTDIAAYSPRYLRAFRVLLPSRVRTRG
jgi:glutamate-1-semialdehyde 2,1-aminomutase